MGQFTHLVNCPVKCPVNLVNCTVNLVNHPVNRLFMGQFIRFTW